MENTLPDFDGKVILVVFDSAVPRNRAVVENPRFELQGGKLFLVGGGLTAKAWGIDVPLAIPWSKVQWYFVFESIEAYDKAEAYYRNVYSAPIA